MQDQAELIGHSNILSYFKNCAARDTLSHAYLFVGPDGVGRMKLLEVFLKEFIPASKIKHPDINIIVPERSVITIDAIRSARSWLSMTPISADKKVLIIDNAARMNTQAQNAFLKILEEPADSTYIFLLISHPCQVLPTIYSRAVPIYFNPVSLCEFIKAGISEAAAKKAQGRPGAINFEPNQDNSFIDELVEEKDPSARMRMWIKKDMRKEEARAWLYDSVAYLRKKLIESRSRTVASALRDILGKLANPSGANWNLAAENLIISL